MSAAKSKYAPNTNTTITETDNEFIAQARRAAEALVTPRPKAGSGLRKAVRPPTEEQAHPAPKSRVELFLTPVTRAGNAYLELTEPSFNYRLVKGFIWSKVRLAGKSWPWDPMKGVRLIPVEDIELLMEGLKSTYKGARLWMGNRCVDL